MCLICVSVSDLDGVDTAELKEKTALIKLLFFFLEIFFPLGYYNLWKTEIKMQRIF